MLPPDASRPGLSWSNEVSVQACRRGYVNDSGADSKPHERCIWGGPHWGQECCTNAKAADLCCTLAFTIIAATMATSRLFTALLFVSLCAVAVCLNRPHNGELYLRSEVDSNVYYGVLKGECWMNPSFDVWNQLDATRHWACMKPFSVHHPVTDGIGSSMQTHEVAGAIQSAKWDWDSVDVCFAMVKDGDLVGVLPAGGGRQVWWNGSRRGGSCIVCCA